MLDLCTGESYIMARGLFIYYTFIYKDILAVRNGLLKCLDGFVFPQTHSFSLYKMLNDALESCGLVVDYCEGFMSCLESHSDGTHSLQRIHW